LVAVPVVATGAALGPEVGGAAWTAAQTGWTWLAETLGLACADGDCGDEVGALKSLSVRLSDLAAKGYIRLVKGSSWRSYYSSFARGTARLRFSLRGGRVLHRIANSEGAARFGEFASVEKPASPVQAILKNALHPSVTSNRARFLYQVTTRIGFYVEGTVASQGSFPGGFTQVFSSQAYSATRYGGPWNTWLLSWNALNEACNASIYLKNSYQFVESYR